MANQPCYTNLASFNLIHVNGFIECFFCGSQFKAFEKSSSENAFDCHAFNDHPDLGNIDKHHYLADQHNHSKCSGQCAREAAVNVELNQIKVELYHTKQALWTEQERQSEKNDAERDYESEIYNLKGELDLVKQRIKGLYLDNDMLKEDYHSERSLRIETQRQLELLENRYDRLQALVDRSNPLRRNAA